MWVALFVCLHQLFIALQILTYFLTNLRVFSFLLQAPQILDDIALDKVKWHVAPSQVIKLAQSIILLLFVNYAATCCALHHEILHVVPILLGHCGLRFGFLSLFLI